MSLLAGTRLGPYEIEAPIGAGGMGEVYRARDERLGRQVAVKVLPESVRGDPERLRRFEQEARATGQLNHPNILAVYDTGTHEGAAYVVAELLEGETLRDRMAGSPIPVRKAIELARQISQGLAAAHAKGIVHRDLKPENLFVTKDGRIKILDFGLAKLEARGATASTLTESPTQLGTEPGVVLGTAGYMSPEQVRGQPVDHRSDIFSFGSILYEMLSGRRAFQADSSIETMNAILKEEPPELSTLKLDVPPGLERVVRHCLEKSPDERFQSARDLAFQLEALSTSSATSAALAAAPVRSTRIPRLPLVPVVLVGLAAIAAAFLAGRRLGAPHANPTYSQLTFRQGSLFSARFTPDGETVVYGASWDGNPTELFTTRPGSPESRSLGLPSAEVLSISRAGEMAVLQNPHFGWGWQRSGTLARAPLAGGVPRQVMESVQDADWTPDGKELAVVRSESGRYRLEYPPGTTLYETPAWISSPRFSRDGKRIGFLDHPANGDDRGRVAVVDLAGHVKPLTDMFSSTAGLAWSPSGEEIWFTAGRTGNVRALYGVDLRGTMRLVNGAPADLVLMDVSASGTVLIARNTARRGMIGVAPGDPTERDLSWLDWSRPVALSKDGTSLLFEEQGQGGGPGYSVYSRKTDGSPAVRLGEGTAFDLSPDGNWALTGSIEQRDKLVLLPLGPGQAREIKVPGFDITNARWFPDGKRYLLLANEAAHSRRLYVLDAEGGTPRPVTAEGMARAAGISPDGRNVVATFPGDLLEIFPAEGGAPRPVPGAVPGDAIAGWSEDGGTLFVAAPARIDRLEMDTGKRTRIKDLVPADRAGLIGVVNVLVSQDARTYVYGYRRVLSTLYLVSGLERE